MTLSPYNGSILTKKAGIYVKRRILPLFFVLFSMLLFSGCCSHKVWNEADCVTPRTCARCDETEGETLEHDWVSATCQHPSFCSTCNTTTGAATEHIWEQGGCETTCKTCGIIQEGSEVSHIWNPATCSSPAQCICCGKTEGEADGDHAWILATTEAPMTCAYCGITQGEPLQVDSRFKPEACKPLFSTWDAEIKLPASIFEFRTPWDPAICQLKFSFGSNGKLFFLLYARSSKTTEIAALAYEGVYYVEDEYLYIGRDWDQPMTKMAVTLIETDESASYYGTVKYDGLVLEGDIMEFCKDIATFVKKDATIDISGTELVKILYDGDGNRIH